MDNSVAKICKNCGPLTKDQVFFREKSTNCKHCIRQAIKNSCRKHKEKIKLRRQKLAEEKRYDLIKHIRELHCNKCDTTKTVDKFHNNMLLIKFPLCKICRNLLTKEHHQKPESKKKHKEWFQQKYEPIARNAQYVKKYGITLEQFDTMSLEQNHLCLICKKPQIYTRRKDGKCFLDVDHCHTTGKIRGLLCLNCNIGLGNFLESKDLLLAAASYLEKNK